MTQNQRGVGGCGTDKRDGKVIGVFKFTVGPDGVSAKASFEDKQQNRTTNFEAMKQ